VRWIEVIVPFAPVHKQLLIGQALGGFFLNFALNGAMGWVSFPPVPSLPLFARGNCIAGDTVGTSFFLPLTTCLILTPIVRGMLRKGAIPALDRTELPRFVRFWPRNHIGRGALVGLISALMIAPWPLFVLSTMDVTAMTRNEDILYKAIYTAILGVMVTPLLGLRALADAPVTAQS
jgi:hypothetical protein